MIGLASRAPVLGNQSTSHEDSKWRLQHYCGPLYSGDGLDSWGFCETGVGLKNVLNNSLSPSSVLSNHKLFRLLPSFLPLWGSTLHLLGCSAWGVQKISGKWCSFISERHRLHDFSLSLFLFYTLTFLLFSFSFLPFSEVSCLDSFYFPNHHGPL